MRTLKVVTLLTALALALAPSGAQDSLPIPPIKVTPAAAPADSEAFKYAQDTATMGLPPIPAYVESQIGPVSVTKVPNLICGGSRAMGCFIHERHAIYIRAGMPRNVEWQTLEHEKFHVILWVSGNTGLLNETQEDRFADAVGSARVLEMLRNLKQPK